MNGWIAGRQSSEESHMLLESIFANVSDAILIVGHDGRIIGANAALERMSKWTIQELMADKHICDICLGMASCREDLTCAECFFSQMQMPSFEMRVKTKSGQEWPVAASSTRIPYRDKHALVVIMRDMTIQHQMERERNRQKLSNYVIHAQEEERKRISRDLHDGVGQAMYSILVGLNMLSHLELEEQAKAYITEVQELTARAMEEVKRLAVELRPSALDDLGLLPAIRSYIKRYAHTFGIETQLQQQGARGRYRSEIEIALYRILQEAMTNAAKYADANRIEVSLEDDGQHLILTVTDDGKGFDPNNIRNQGTGLGLFGMRERANLLGGDLEIRSAAGSGTQIRATIPTMKEGATDEH